MRCFFTKNFLSRLQTVFFVLVISACGGILSSAGAYDEADLEACIVEKMLHAGDETTIGELKAACRHHLEGLKRLAPEDVIDEDVEESAIKRRQEIEQETEELPFVLTPHKPNYILLAAYNTQSPNQEPYTIAHPDEDYTLDQTEVKFQVSLKFPVLFDLFGDNGDLFFAYTNRSFWQLYNSDISAPFRETNHEPEFWLSFDTDWNFLGIKNRIVRLGAVHQSNGQSGNLSRSWNRIFAQFLFERNNFYFSLKPWWRLPEDEEDDNNPDIEDYLGYFEFQAIYKVEKELLWQKWLKGSTFSLLWRNNLKFNDDNRGATQLDWSFPLYRHLRGYAQWFNGYGESMIDYDSNVNSFGIGLQLTDWL
ncbi:MAG: phospholipase A [Thermodesulfobacteriota bacterium]|nr:phospholipase A [Thermodesulfobacteriota bacterium]